MASKNVPATEKTKVSRKGFFQRSESVMSDSYEKNLTADAVNVDSDKRVIRRSSMICSEGFDKYTFDCHRRDIPSRSVGLELDATAISDEPTHNKSSPVPENATHSQSSKSTPIEYSPGKPVSFKPLSPLSATVKNAPLPFKRVPEETIPFNIPSYKRVPEETIPVAKPYSNISSDKSPVTNIPFLFNPIPEESGWTGNTSKSSSNKSAPVRSMPFSFRHVSGDSTPTRNTPLSFKCISEETPAVKALSFRSASGQFALMRNKPLSFEEASEEYTPARNVPLSFKHVPDKTISRSNISTQAISGEFTPARNVPLSLKHVPDKGNSKNNISSQVVSDEFIPHRNSPLSLKHVPSENASSKKTHTSLRFFNKPSTPRDRDISLPFQCVPEEPVHGSHPLTYKDVPDEPIPARNSPLSLKPLLSKHISLLKKKSPSVKSPIIKRDSVVHPGRIDMQSSLCIDGRFQNPWPTWRPPTFTNILKFGVTRNKSKVPPKQELDLVLPIVKQNFSKLTIPDEGIRVTWIGHSTVLVQMHGLNILTDPMFSDRASPSQVVGPKRYRDPPCSIHDLPHINAVVISHSHYDHLDYNTITLLNARFGTDIRWFVPLGLQTWMEHVGCENVVELDWWEENCVPEHSDTFFVFTPAQHWSKRTIGDDNKVLWGSWCVLGPKYRFFFAGDTGYCDVFKQIGRIHGPFDLSAIPIGAYEPRWFMKYQHVNPEEAVKIHMDVKSKKSLAIHWGTFCLANEYYLDPPVKLRDSLDKYEILPELFFTLKHGDSRLIAQNNLVKRYPLSDKNSNNS